MNDFDRLSNKKPDISLLIEMSGLRSLLVCVLQSCEVILERIGIHLQDLCPDECLVLVL